LLFSAACGSQTGKETDRAIEQKKQDAAHFDTQPTNEIWLTPEQERLADLTTDTARMREVGDELVLNGLLEVPPQHYARLHAPIPAFVKSVRVKEGEKVNHGQVLMWLEHPDAVDLQRSYLENTARIIFLEAETERQELLAQKQATDRRSLEQSRADYQSALAQRASLEAQLQRLHTSILRALIPNRFQLSFRLNHPFPVT
jgi:cobalt-zinc-cadmium efflux system membrane fusion protein